MVSCNPCGTLLSVFASSGLSATVLPFPLILIVVVKFFSSVRLDEVPESSEPIGIASVLSLV